MHFFFFSIIHIFFSFFFSFYKSAHIRCLQVFGLLDFILLVMGKCRKQKSDARTSMELKLIRNIPIPKLFKSSLDILRVL